MQPNYDCSKLLINFTNVPRGKKLVDHFPELRVFPEFTHQQDEKVIKIAILTADADSPFWKLRADRELMIKAIFDFLEIGMQNTIGKELYKKVLDYKHEGVTECWSAYLQLQYNIDFNDWAISQQTYNMLLVEANRPRTESETVADYSNWRVKIRNLIRQIGVDLKQIEPNIFKDSKMARAVAIEQIRKIKSYPEKHAIKHSIM